jgi:hypothetical protein
MNLSSFLVKCVDKTALLDPSNDCRIDNQVRICLFGLGILQRKNVQTAFDHWQRRDRHVFQFTDGRLIVRLALRLSVKLIQEAGLLDLVDQTQIPVVFFGQTLGLRKILRR